MASLQVCVHGHFYQPPREDPLTGEIPMEPGAAPYQNWNERIHEQCYRPNARLGNFQNISFNIGPTLATWMESCDPDTLNSIVQQEQNNFVRYGVGNAIAQSYNHTILPLASLEDKKTQIVWGIRSFENLFHHKPLGMWLPETAVDLETLDVMADHGIEFTILAPWQADQKELDTSLPYKVECPNGKSMVVFFYNQDLSTRISFDPGSTDNADKFVEKSLLPRFKPASKGKSLDQLLLIASDGELYGHHQPFRDKFLSYLLDGALKNSNVKKNFSRIVVKTTETEPEYQNYREYFLELFAWDQKME